MSKAVPIDSEFTSPVYCWQTFDGKKCLLSLITQKL